MRACRIYRDMARALARAGAAYLGAGRPDLAGDRLYRAARSFQAQGEVDEARRLLEMAESAARRTNDAELLGRIRLLRNTTPGNGTRPADVDGDAPPDTRPQ